MRRRRMSTSVEKKIIKDVFFGTVEPSLDKHLGDILNWYSSVCEDKQARVWLAEYLTARHRDVEAQSIDLIHSDWVPRTAAWLARLDARGYMLSAHNHETIENKLKDALCHLAADGVGYKPTVQDYMKEKASEIIGEVEGMIDDGDIAPGFSMYDELKKRNVSGLVAAKMIEHFAPVADELIDALSPQDTDLKEGYKKYSPQEKEDMAVVYQTIIDDLNAYVGNAKLERKPRTKSKAKPEKQVAKLPYAKSNDQHQLVSIDPLRIIGAQELWTFNPKTMVLTVFRANDSDGLAVRGSRIININEKTSMAKKSGKRTKERLKTVLHEGKLALRRAMDDLLSKGSEPGRLTKDTILLRVEKR